VKEQPHYQPDRTQAPHQRGEGIRGVPPPPQGEQAKPQQESVEGGKGQQELITFDGHEPEAYRRDPAIFTGRTLEGTNPLQKEIEPAREGADRVDGIYQDEAARLLARNGKVDLNDMLGSLLEHKFGNRYYERGLRDAFDLIVTHLKGKREMEQEGNTNAKK
jgi:hypothetical protein